jgi:hypothetical protein
MGWSSTISILGIIPVPRLREKPPSPLYSWLNRQRGPYSLGPIFHGVQAQTFLVRGVGNPPPVILDGHYQMVLILFYGNGYVFGHAMPGGIEHRLPDDIVDMGCRIVIKRFSQAAVGKAALHIIEAFDLDDKFFNGSLQTLLNDMHRIETMGQPPGLFYRLPDQVAYPAELQGLIRRIGLQFLLQDLAQHFDAAEVGTKAIMEIAADLASFLKAYRDDLPLKAGHFHFRTGLQDMQPHPFEKHGHLPDIGIVVLRAVVADPGDHHDLAAVIDRDIKMPADFGAVRVDLPGLIFGESCCKSQLSSA